MSIISSTRHTQHPPIEGVILSGTDIFIYHFNRKAGLCAQNYYVNGTRPGFKFFRYHKKSAECFPIDDKGPCGRNMIFYRIGNTEYGECDCDHSKRCGRPLLYWQPTDSCYHVNTQGPCREGHWLAYGLTQKPICQKNLCLRQESESPSNHRARKFWISINGMCMKTRTLGFCPDPEQVMFFREGEAYPQCVHPSEATVCGAVNRISRPCWAGQKFDSMDNCRDKVGLWGSEDDH
ncbi:uncharacterized protein LOC110853872 isoform X2 [Folsomia candida]|uniref:uncharacterized protein LOC110853872 isoform X2 n=1 Tax=Folsomia candida TaxID=158441 RepID=UPI000B9009AF|nr:uncharacterized protein LOC110853872 isoform X2 [Folsomia candida]